TKNNKHDFGARSTKHSKTWKQRPSALMRLKLLLHMPTKAHKESRTPLQHSNRQSKRQAEQELPRQMHVWRSALLKTLHSKQNSELNSHDGGCLLRRLPSRSTSVR